MLGALRIYINPDLYTQRRLELQASSFQIRVPNPDIDFPLILMSASAGFPLLDALRSILSEKKPFCNGTLGLPARGFVLYYGQGRDAW